QRPAEPQIERASVHVALAGPAAVAVHAGPALAVVVEHAVSAADRVGLAVTAQADGTGAAFQDRGARRLARAVAAARAESTLAVVLAQRGARRQRPAGCQRAAFTRLVVRVRLAQGRAP